MLQINVVSSGISICVRVSACEKVVLTENDIMIVKKHGD